MTKGGLPRRWQVKMFRHFEAVVGHKFGIHSVCMADEKSYQHQEGECINEVDVQFFKSELRVRYESPHQFMLPPHHG